MKVGNRGGRLPLVFALTLVLSAALLFFVQPMFTKMVLPQFGASPAVWNTCLLFFQIVLLAGYAYAHLLHTRLGVRSQVAVHALLLLLPLASLPIAAAKGWEPPTAANPAVWLLGLLGVAMGLPFFVVSTSAPLLQGWFARTGHAAARDPYFLYAASNLGSLGALIAYPLVVERILALRQQSLVWACGYLALVALVLVCGASLWRARETEAVGGAPALDDAPPPASSSGVTTCDRVLWVALAALPSSLLLSVTLYLTSDIASVPLLWMIPLALYLLTFILAFARRRVLSHEAAARIMPLFVIAWTLLIVSEATHPVWLVMLVHLATFFVAALICHGELARRRPPASRLTEFYLWIAVGGALGGLLSALAAPFLFRSVAEYPLALVAACLFRPGPAGAPAGKSRPSNAHTFLPRVLPAHLDVLWPLALGLVTFVLVGASRRAHLADPLGMAVAFGLPLVVCYSFQVRPVRFALGIAALLCAAQFRASVHGQVLHAERSFFGIHRVTLDPTGQFVQLVHGSTVHGMERLVGRGTDSSPAAAPHSAGDQRPEPLAYYHRSGPIGQVFALPRLREARPPVAVVGLGAGSLAAYAQSGQEIDFYEIDPVVQRIAEDGRHFTFLRQCPAKYRVILGDGRLNLARSPDSRYGLIVLDAFSSDAVPLHLVTREAIAVYLDKLAAGGAIALNVSSRYLELRPVLADLARERGLVGLARADAHVAAEERRQGKAPSIWVVLARRTEDLRPLAHDPRWERLSGRPHAVVWTDDYANILSVLKWE